MPLSISSLLLELMSSFIPHTLAPVTKVPPEDIPRHLQALKSFSRPSMLHDTVATIRILSTSYFHHSSSLAIAVIDTFIINKSKCRV